MTSELGDAGASKGLALGFPPTRYQGSKRKLLPWLESVLSPLSFDSALDLFGGTGCVSYLLKSMGKRVVYNDVLRCNQLGGKALIENDAVLLDDADVSALFERQPGVAYDDFIERTFDGVYFLREENQQLDTAVQNALGVDDPMKQALLFHALFQAALAKRPYGLFHRANLSMRTADVARRFGNKVTWDRQLLSHVQDAASAANRAVFSNGHTHKALCEDALTCEEACELVYIDPPYVPARGAPVDYLGFYHFLEGMASYRSWGERIDLRRRNRPLRKQASPFCSKTQISAALEGLFARHADRVLVVSYRDDGVPSASELVALLGQYKRRVEVHRLEGQRYVLSTRSTAELLLVGS